MAQEKIFIIEDEQDIADLMRFALEKEQYKVSHALSGESALERLGESMPNLILLDRMLPGIDGIETCRRIKANSKIAHIPIIIVTAKGEESDIIVGLEMGADDYVCKPFSNKVLTARIKAVLRRVSAPKSMENDVIIRGDFTLNLGRRALYYLDQEITLTFTEFEVLKLLMRRPGWVFTRAQIVNQTKGSDYPVTERAVDVQIVGLRKKLGEAGECIETVRGVGYRFKD